MYGVSDVWAAFTKPCEGGVPAGLVPRDQYDPGAHFCECYCGDFANSGRATGNYNSLPSHKRSRSLLTNVTQTTTRLHFEIGKMRMLGSLPSFSVLDRVDGTIERSGRFRQC